MTGYPAAYLDYLVFFHADRDYFECHEVMEAYWKEVPDDPLTGAWLGLIQVAVSQYHERRGNRAGARKMMESAIRNLRKPDLDKLGIDGSAFLVMLRERFEELLQAPVEPADFADLNIPLTDPELLLACRKLSEGRNVCWLRASDPSDPDLLHKHTRRDRTPVVLERERNKELKRLEKGKGSG